MVCSVSIHVSRIANILPKPVHCVLYQVLIALSMAPSLAKSSLNPPFFFTSLCTHLGVSTSLVASTRKLIEELVIESSQLGTTKFGAERTKLLGSPTKDRTNSAK